MQACYAFGDATGIWLWNNPLAKIGIGIKNPEAESRRRIFWYVCKNPETDRSMTRFFMYQV